MVITVTQALHVINLETAFNEHHPSVPFPTRLGADLG